MTKWEEIELGKLAEIQTGPFGSQLHQRDYVPVGTPLITVKNLGENKVNDNKLDFVSDKDKERLSKFILQEGDIVFSRVGYVDRRAFITKKESGWLFSGSTLRVRVKETSTLNPKYLSYYFGQKSFKDEIKNMSVGATRPSLNTQLLEELEIIIPPLPEQRAIASVLSSLDDKIDLLHRQNKTLEAMVETLFRQWFVEEADEGWAERPIGQLFEISSGKGLKKEQFNDIGPYPVLGANGEMGRTDNYLYDEKLIFTGRVGTLGNIFVIDNEKVWLSDNTLVIRPKEYFYSVYFILKTSKLERYNVGSTQPLIRQSDIKKIEIALPPEKTLREFECEAESPFQKINTNKYQIRTLEKLRDTLLPKLMSGDVRVEFEENT